MKLWRSLIAHEEHGPLPALLLALTVLTGIVDAVSILSLGRVFVANMTGNVVFVGFAIAGAPGFVLSASLAALAGFLAGALLGGRAIRAYGANRALLLRRTLTAESSILVAALVIAAAVGTPYGTAVKDVIAALLAVGMGLQNAAARRLAVPDVTTTVLTMTLTGLAADVRAGRGPVVLRRLLAVATMLAGAVAGALLILDASVLAALAVAVGITLATTSAAALVGRAPAPWQ